MSKRLPGWPTLLNEFLATRMCTPFQWGLHDCCLFAADAIQAITGIDVARRYRKAYATREAAMHLIHIHAEHGIREFLKAIAKDNGFEMINPKMAQRGDIIMFNSHQEGGAGITLGVVIDHRCLSPGIKALQYYPMAQLWELPSTKAWKIG